jgi:hypothetical protein
MDDKICHSVVEVEYQGKWILLDPLQNLFYLNSQQQPGSLQEIASGQAYPFELSKATTTLDLKQLKLSRQDIVYTNWKKIPLFGRLVDRRIRKLPDDHPLRTLSLRSHLLNMHAFVSFTAFLLSVIFAVSSVMLGRRPLSRRQ